MNAADAWYVPAGHTKQPSRSDRSDPPSTAPAVTTAYSCPTRLRPRYAGVPVRLWLALARGLPDCTLLTKAFLKLWSYVTDATLPAL